MYPPKIARSRPDAVAYVMAESGASLTYGELDRRSNQLAHRWREHGVGSGDTVVIAMENNIEWPVVVAAGMRTGLYVTPVNWHLQPSELTALVAECEPAVVVTSAKLASVVRQATESVGHDPLLQSVDDGVAGFEYLATAVKSLPDNPVDGELLGARVLFSGGTTGRPKAFRQALLGVHPEDAPPRHAGLVDKLGIDADTVLLSPAPNYHAAPFTFQLITLAVGGTVVCMEKFDAEAALRAIDTYRVTHSQWVPTMLVRLLNVADKQQFTGAAHRVAFTSGAPCSVDIKTRIDSWWGPVLHEYYGASEGYGHTYIAPSEARLRPGSVGKPLGPTVVHITDAEGAEVPSRTVGTVWFESTAAPSYRNAGDVNGWKQMGDLGYLDDDGYLYLVGRTGYMIISGGVNIYPDEIEETLIAHPGVLDAAVFGVPDAEFGERVKAVVELREPSITAAELIEFCRDRLAHFKAPREVEFTSCLPRLPTGKLNKRALKDAFAHSGGQS
ncbi:fatty-acid--CoA ligase [Rhodococcus sp. Eu-32]|uniref:AMP-binding protein n=1 Tax=Rhodococcus sp. Eu-32 TaxID=1017319 RepID=UPI000DF38E2D|nr:AMP-binding protein [Rhodococcus sp. Eu-32]RRQ27441.1 fatty-acid--CoA ligase [Rhodococcus sp. Eu-32]